MAEAIFDPDGYYEFDLARGAVHARGGGRVLVVPDNVMSRLVSAAAQSEDHDALRALGASIGNSVGEGASRSPESVLSDAAAAVAVFGFGHLGLERWGDALVTTLEAPPAIPETAQGAILEGVLEALAGQPVRCIPVSNGRFLVVHPDAAAAITDWVAKGEPLGSLVTKLAAEAS